MYAAPTAAASVGVTKPPRMPPRMTTGAPNGAITRRPVTHTWAQAELGALEVRHPPHPQEDDDAQADRHQEGRHHRCGEERPGRHPGESRVDDGGDARRHHRCDQRGRAHHAQGERLGVAGPQHGRDLHLAERGRVRDGRSAHPGEPEADPDADVAQASPHPPEQRQGEVEEPVGDPRVVGDAAQEDEQRHREQREARRRARHQPERQAEGLVGRDHVQQAGTEERERDRDPDRQQPGDEQAEHEDAHSVGTPTTSYVGSGTPCTAYWTAAIRDRITTLTKPISEMP